MCCLLMARLRSCMGRYICPAAPPRAPSPRASCLFDSWPLQSIKGHNASRWVFSTMQRVIGSRVVCRTARSQQRAGLELWQQKSFIDLVEKHKASRAFLPSLSLCCVVQLALSSAGARLRVPPVRRPAECVCSGAGARTRFAMHALPVTCFCSTGARTCSRFLTGCFSFAAVVFICLFVS